MKSTMSFRKKAGYVFAASVIGTVTGIMTLIGQKYLPVNLNFLSNSASMWLVPAFFVPYCVRGSRKQSALLGVIVLICCVLGYYLFEAGYNHHSYFLSRNQCLWLCCAFIGGVVFGLCANLSRAKIGIVKSVSMNILPAVFVTESLSKLFHVNDYSHMLYGVFLQMFIGLMLYAVINRKNMLKAKNILSFVILLILGSAAFEIIRRF